MVMAGFTPWGKWAPKPGIGETRPRVFLAMGLSFQGQQGMVPSVKDVGLASW